VTIDRGQAGQTTLDGTGFGEIHIGRDGSNDTVNANEGNDVLMGFGGNDTLNGGVGDDMLVGGAGTDTMTGGADSDGFVWISLADGLDTLTDFAASDLLLFDSNTFGTGLATGGANTGTLDASRFVADTTGFANNIQRFWYDTANGVLYFDADGSDGGASIAIVTLSNLFALNNTHIQLFD
jgi:Ca2+-binding RTX toxin-like protein